MQFGFHFNVYGAHHQKYHCVERLPVISAGVFATRWVFYFSVENDDQVRVVAGCEAVN